MDCSLPGFSVHGILQARTLEWVAISFSNAWKWKVKVKSLSHVRLLATPRTAAYRLLHPWYFPGNSTWVGCHCILSLSLSLSLYIYIYIYSHPAYLTYMQSTSGKMLRWTDHKLESRLLGEISTTSLCRWYHFNGTNWRGTEEHIGEEERVEWKSWLKTQHSKN